MRKMRMKRRKSKTMMKGMKMMKNRKKNRMKNRKILKAKIDLKKEMSMRMMRIEMKRKIGKRKKKPVPLLGFRLSNKPPKSKDTEGMLTIPKPGIKV